ncbi:MAG: hypothetical protein CFE21_09195 [Bacteroidetes bacterium B1(2017)]|nr:MAG: hypothetical protein CFE21_09195 [Bacteroidetes bacterium B1(2017)]
MISKFTLTFILLFIVVTTNAQIQKFDYKSKYGGFDFTSTRTIINDTVFIDSGLLCSSDTAKICSITFKKIKLAWFVMVDGQWQEFYNPVDSSIKVVYFKNEKFILKPIGNSLKYDGVSLFGFIKEELYVYSSHITTLWFDPNLGVVIIDGDEQLIRQDFARVTGK